MGLSIESINCLLKKSKIHVSNSEESAQIQHKLFELGCGWYGRTGKAAKQLLYLNAPYIYIDGYKRLTYGNGSGLFKNHSYRELFPDDILSLIEDKDEFLEII